MHISEGVLSGPVLIAGFAIAAVGTSMGLRHLRDEEVPKTAVLTSAFFVASLIHIPIGPGSAHLVLNGLLGVLLGWAAFPAILVGLALQGMLFQFGGITTLGVNAVIMGFPAVLSSLCFGGRVNSPGKKGAVAAFLAGSMAIFLSGIVAGLFLFASDAEFLEVAAMITLAHLPVMVAEGFLTAFCVRFLQKVSPELLPDWRSAMPTVVKAPNLEPSER